MKHVGNFLTRGNYGAAFVLDDGTPVNVMTLFTGPGLATEMEIEAQRPLTRAEQEAVAGMDGDIDHALGPHIEYAWLPVQHQVSW